MQLDKRVMMVTVSVPPVRVPYHSLVPWLAPCGSEQARWYQFIATSMVYCCSNWWPHPAVRARRGGNSRVLA